MGKGPAIQKKAIVSKTVVKRKRKVIADGSEEEAEETHTVKKARVVGGARKTAAKKVKAAKTAKKVEKKVDAKRAGRSRGKNVVSVDDSSESDSGGVIVLDSDKAEEDLDDEDEAQGDGDEHEDGDEVEGQENEGDDGNEGDSESSDNEAIAIPKGRGRKKDSTRDLRLIFTGVKETVVFTEEDGHEEEEEGMWCTICRDDKEVMREKGARAGWYRGGNSSLRRHIASEHYPKYAALCKENGISENHRAVPDDVKAERAAKEKAAAKGKKGGQTTLDGIIKKVQTPTSFTQEAILQAVTEHVVCGDQALAIADDVTFRNCLVTMRPKTSKSELPGRESVRSHITNKFIEYVEQLKADIEKAPGSVSTLCDMWTAPNTSNPFMGLMVTWIQVGEDGVWTFRDEVAAFHYVLGDHTGANLGRYIVLFLDRCGVTSKQSHKLGHMTNDNASNNYTSAKAVGKRLTHRGIAGDWTALDRNLGCYGHIIQLGVEAFMGRITQKAVAETKQAIWDFDPNHDDSLVGGGLDIISILRTLCVKINASGQRKQLFQKIQMEEEEDLVKPLTLVLHTTTRWMSAGKMLNRTYRLKKTIKAFVAIADLRFGPITTIRRKGARAKKIAWSAFQLTDEHWDRVNLCAKILEDADSCHQLCSSTRSPTLHHVIPALERLVTKWEKKAQDPKYALFHEALKAGIEKLNKYYKKLDNSDAYILSLLLHPYYKLNYIRVEWGGEQEYLEALDAGDPDARDWNKYAREVTEKAMRKYWPLRLGRSAAAKSAVPTIAAASRRADHAGSRSGSGSGSDSEENEYDKARQALLQQGEPEDGWKVELESYLKDPAGDVTKDTDTVLYWQRAHKMWPTLGRMALDILPIAAASVGIESLFSRAKEVSTDRRASLDPELFEQIECLKYHWTPKLINYAHANHTRVNQVDVREFENLLKADTIVAAAYENDDGLDDDSD